MMWFLLIEKEGGWTSPKNLFWGAVNAAIFLIGLVVLVAGTYASVDDIVSLFALRNKEMFANYFRTTNSKQAQFVVSSPVPHRSNNVFSTHFFVYYLRLKHDYDLFA